MSFEEVGVAVVRMEMRILDLRRSMQEIEEENEQFGREKDTYKTKSLSLSNWKITNIKEMSQRAVRGFAMVLRVCDGKMTIKCKQELIVVII